MSKDPDMDKLFPIHMQIVRWNNNRFMKGGDVSAKQSTSRGKSAKLSVPSTKRKRQSSARKNTIS